MKYFLVVFFAVFLSIEAQQTDREQENIRANLRNDFQPKHYDCKRKFNDLAYLTGRNFHPVIQSLTQQWDRTKIRVIELFNPLPCGNCKEIARKIENDLNFNIAAFREEYTIDRLHQRLREGFRDGYERFLLPASNYMDEFKPYKEQLKNVMTCWSTTRKNIFKIFDDAYLDALKNISKAIHGFENEYKNIGESFDQGVINATKEAAKCTSYKQGFGYCEFLYFDDYHQVFMNNFRKTRRDAYNIIEQALSGLEAIIYNVSIRSRQQYVDETTKLENCLSMDSKNGTEKTNKTNNTT